MSTELLGACACTCNLQVVLGTGPCRFPSVPRRGDGAWWESASVRALRGHEGKLTLRAQAATALVSMGGFCPSPTCFCSVLIPALIMTSSKVRPSHVPVPCAFPQSLVMVLFGSILCTLYKQASSTHAALPVLVSPPLAAGLRLRTLKV